MYNKLKEVIDGSGIWTGARGETHAFLLSPSVYEITTGQRQELSALGYALYDCLAGLSHIAVIAYDRHLNYGNVWGLARKVFSTGVPSMYTELQGMNVRHLPKLLKVDLMVDRNGHFRIAEIDGHNKHGVGYSTLGLRFRQALYPEAKSLPGTVMALAIEIKRLEHNRLKLFYADQERFYLPEFEIVRQEFLKHGIDCLIVSEMEADNGFLEEGLFLDLPFLYHHMEHYSRIVAAYKAGNVSFIIPPKPFLGAKGVLALLRNDGGNPQLEALMRTFIRGQSLDIVRGYIPETLLVGRQAKGFEAIRRLVADKRYVLKESISSGMKGTVFSDSPDFETVLVGACCSRLNWILQEEVENQPQTFSWYEKANGDAPMLQTSSDWYMRVTVQYVNRVLADAIVTARRDKSVHGAKDCLQLGTIVL